LADRTAAVSDATTYVAVWEAIWRIERDLGLLEREIAGVRYWPLIRGRVVDIVSHALGLFALSQPRFRSFGSRQIVSHALPLATHHSLSPWRISGSFDSILVPFARKHLQEGRPTDIFTGGLLNEPALGRTLVLDAWDPREMLAPSERHEVRSRNHFTARALAGAIVYLPALVREIERHRGELSAAIRRELQTEAMISAAHFALRIAVFKEGRRLARQVIRRSGARRLFFVTGQGAGAIAAAAQDCGLPTFEFQHGMIGRYQSAYHYPGRPFVPYAADTLLLFGPHWRDSAEFARNTRTLVIGSSNIAKYRELAVARHPRRVFIASQGTIGRQLFALVCNAARLAPEWAFVFRPHPHERSALYPELSLPVDKPANLRISSAKEDFYALLASSAVQVGVYSTTLFEGMALGVRSIVVALPGWEQMAQVIAQGDAVLAHDAGDIARLLSSAPAAAQPERYYAAPPPSIAELIGLS
jgi:hypothetical protein